MRSAAARWTRRLWPVGAGRVRRAAAGVVVVGLAMAGCGGGDGVEEAEDEPRSEVSVQDATDTTGAPRARADLPKAVEPDLQLRHPNGTVVSVRRLSFTPTSMAVDIEVVNGFTKAVSLNSRGCIWPTTWATATTSWPPRPTRS